MKNRLAATIALMIVATGCHDGLIPTQAAGPAIPQDEVMPAARAPRGIPGEYIVVFNRDVTDPQGKALSLAAASGASVRFIYVNSIKGFAAHMSATAATALAKDPDVAYVEPDQEVNGGTLGQQPTNPVGRPWGLDRIDQVDLPLDGSYSYALDGSGVKAYLIGDGILASHAEFQSEFGSRVVDGFTAISDGKGTSDCSGAGTLMAGTVGGLTYGVAKAVTLVPVRVLDCALLGRVSGVIAGIEWVTTNHRDLPTPAVANLGAKGVASVAMDEAVQASIAAGVPYVVSSGSGSGTSLVAQDACKLSPGRVPEAMTTGATDSTDTKAYWTSYGDCVDWFAPALMILSSFGTNDNAIGITNASTPHTTGVAALYLQAFPNATPQQVRDGLYNATTKGIVRTTNGFTANSHLLYSPPEGFSSLPSLISTTLAVTTSKVKTNWTATLIWSGFSAAVDVYKNGIRIATNISASSYRDSGKGTGSMTYRVCQVLSAGNCTNAVTVRP